MGINRFSEDEEFDFEDEATHFEDYFNSSSEMIIPADINKMRQEELSLVSQKANSAILKIRWGEQDRAYRVPVYPENVIFP